MVSVVALLHEVAPQAELLRASLVLATLSQNRPVIAIDEGQGFRVFWRFMSPAALRKRGRLPRLRLRPVTDPVPALGHGLHQQIL